MKNEGLKLQTKFTCSVKRVNIFASAMVNHTWLSGLHMLRGYGEQNVCNPWLL